MSPTRKTIPMVLAVVMSLIAGPALASAPDGKALYDSKCAGCHGKNGVAKSTAKGSANLNDPKWQEANSVEAIEKVTSEGKGTMKGFKSKLKPEQIKAIAAHVKSLK